MGAGGERERAGSQVVCPFTIQMQHTYVEIQPSLIYLAKREGVRTGSKGKGLGGWGWEVMGERDPVFVS